MSSPSDCVAEAELFELIDLLEKNAESLGARRAAVQRLRQAIQQGSEALREQSQAYGGMQRRLLSHVSHALRTPLTPALLSVCLLQRDQTLPDDVRDGLAAIQRHIEQEAMLIDSLIEQAAFDSRGAESPSRTRIA